MRDPTPEQYEAFREDCLPLDFDDCAANVNKSFQYMRKKHALAYVWYLKSLWFSWENHTCSSIEKFLKWNGNPPKDFFEKFILPTTYRATVMFQKSRFSDNIIQNFYYEF